MTTVDKTTEPVIATPIATARIQKDHTHVALQYDDWKRHISVWRRYEIRMADSQMKTSAFPIHDLVHSAWVIDSGRDGSGSYVAFSDQIEIHERAPIEDAQVDEAATAAGLAQGPNRGRRRGGDERVPLRRV